MKNGTDLQYSAVSIQRRTKNRHEANRQICTDCCTVNEMNEDTMTNMSLDVGQLHLNDLEDSDKYDSTGYGVSVSTGGSESLGERQDGSISAEYNTLKCSFPAEGSEGNGSFNVCL